MSWRRPHSISSDDQSGRFYTITPSHQQRPLGGGFCLLLFHIGSDIFQGLEQKISNVYNLPKKEYYLNRIESFVRRKL